MDSITHLALGACMGEALADKKLGKKAMLWGAVAQSVPDIDFLASFWMDTPGYLLAHRGFTHSILFCALITFVFALLAERLHRPHNIRLIRWIWIFAILIYGHIFLDAFNNYGVGWFEPFSHQRISFNTVYVADPFFSLWPIIACVALLLFKRAHAIRKKIWIAGIGFAALYLGYCVWNKIRIDRDIRTIFQAQHISYTRYFSTPAPLQNWLWYVVAGDDSGYHVGFRSVFDSRKQIDFAYYPRNKALLLSEAPHEAVDHLIRFSQEFYTVEKWKDTLVFNDLRFGQINGWEPERGRFVFHYYLQHPEANKLVVQRGRMDGWNRQSMEKYIRRIMGN